MTRIRFILLLLLIVSIQLVSRYLPTPATGFIADDWRSLYWGRTMSWSEISEKTLDELDRPLCMFFIPSTFKILDDSVTGFALLSILYNSLAIILYGLLVYSLTRSQTTMILAALIFALLPNITESFHWAHHTSIGFVNLAYISSMLFGLVYVQSESRRVYAYMAALSYAVALFAYETGALLPLAMLALWPLRSRWRYLLKLTPYGIVVALYIAWRAGYLGASRHIVNYRNYLDQSYSLADMVYNFRASLSWWFGGHMLQVIADGINGFLAWPTLMRLLLITVNVFIMYLAYRAVVRKPQGVQPHAPEADNIRVVIYALLWVGASLVPSVIAWPAGRLNYLPGMGAALLIALAITRGGGCRSLLLLGVLLLAINQGTTRHWYESGVYQAKMYDYLRNHISEWSKKEVIYIDTYSLRQRQTRGLLSPVSREAYAWSLYGNAQLARSFVASAIVDHLVREYELTERPRVILDMEYSTEIVNDYLIWHGRFHLNETNMIPLSSVFTIDAISVGQQPSSE